MEDGEPPSTSKTSGQLKPGDFEITSNWKIVNDRLFHNTISTVDVTRSPGRADLEDVVSLETCIQLEGDANEKREPCSVAVRLRNGQKIARIAIVSEAFLIEIYKRFGEYVATAHAEFIDEFEQSAVYFADVSLNPPTPEVSIKFARLKNPGMPMWLYGIRLSLTPPDPSYKAEQFDYNVIGELLQNKVGKEERRPVDWAMKILERSERREGKELRDGSKELDMLAQHFMSANIDSSKNACVRSREEAHTAPSKEVKESIGDSKDVGQSDVQSYIDHRLREMEVRLTKRIDAMDLKTNEKLDNIIKLLSNKSQ